MATSYVSIIVATFNSARMLPQVLEAIRTQTYPQDHIEILLIDGGSTDNTKAIGKSFGARVIINPKVEPLYAKYLGYTKAQGDYIIYIDHDEVLLNKNSIAQRVKFFTENPDVKAIAAGGYTNPQGYRIINRYINEFGDSFSFFMYRLSKNIRYFVPTMKKRYPVVAETADYAVFNLSASESIPLIELGAGGGMLDGKFFKKAFPQIITQYHLVPHFLHLLRKTHPFLAVMKNDALLHYSPDDLNGYINKLIWRIKNNIFYTDTIGASGYAGREEYQHPLLRLKKFLFIPYAFSMFLPAIDALFLIISRRDPGYAIHVPLSVMTAGLIGYYTILKFLGVRPQLKSYDGTTTAYEKK